MGERWQHHESSLLEDGGWGGSYFLACCHVKQQQHHNEADLYHSRINWYNRSMLFQNPLQTPEGSVFLLPQTPTLNWVLSFALEGYEALYSTLCTGFSSAYLVPYTETAKPSSTTLPGYTTSSTLSLHSISRLPTLQSGSCTSPVPTVTVGSGLNDHYIHRLKSLKILPWRT